MAATNTVDEWIDEMIGGQTRRGHEVTRLRKAAKYNIIPKTDGGFSSRNVHG